MITVTDNCGPAPVKSGARNKDLPLWTGDARKLKGDLHLDLATYRSKKNELFSFFADPERRSVKNGDEELIVSLIRAADGEYLVRTGNYVGKFVHEGMEFDIRSRFGDVFLQRMLNFASDIYLDDVVLLGRTKDDQSLDHSRLVIYYLFVQSLEKTFLLGLPKAYQSVHHHDMAVRGRVDINRFIRKDIPFLGKISSISREQHEIQPIVDVLFKAIRVMEENGGREIARRVAHIRAHLKERKSDAFVSAEMIRRAAGAKALQNPVFAPYKKVLFFAELIIKSCSIEDDSHGKTPTHGFLINVAELFEIYVSRLLAQKFPSWRVSSPKIELYGDQFYARKIIPDIVMENDDEQRVAVLDTKYKRMQYRKRGSHNAGDLDRTDFFQINTYMSYYQQQTRKKLIVGGLLYPLSSDLDEAACHADWMGNSGIRFVVDGIRVPDAQEWDFGSVIASENAFVKRLESLLEA